MLIAKNKQNQLLNLADENYSAEKVRESAYYCPTCEGKLVFKSGEIKIPHFAHQAKSDCESFSEGETAAHLHGKQVLYRWGGEMYQLEAPLKKLQQRPDILFVALAIELQCSPLSIQRLEERMMGYIQNLYQQWWILGEPLSSQPKLTALTKKMCYFYDDLGICFWTFNQETDSLQLNFQVQDLGDGRQRWRSAVFHSSDVELHKPFYWPEKFVSQENYPDDEGICRVYQRKIAEKLMRMDPKVLAVQEAMYLKGGNLLSLPLDFFKASDFRLLFGDWLLFFRYLVFCSFDGTEETYKEIYDKFLLEASGYLSRFSYPLIDMDWFILCLFEEMVNILFPGWRKKLKC